MLQAPTPVAGTVRTVAVSQLDGALQTIQTDHDMVLLDCLTRWGGNSLLAETGAALPVRGVVAWTSAGREARLGSSSATKWGWVSCHRRSSGASMQTNWDP